MSQQVIKTPDTVPPGGGWVYIDPDTHQRFRANSLMTLQKAVTKHKQASARELDPTEFVNNVCANAHPGVCLEVDDFNRPTALAMAKNFGTAMYHWAVGDGFHTVSQRILDERLSICQTCEYWGGKRGESLLRGRCALCGCSGVKLAIPSQSCPRGLWPAV